MEKTEPSRCCPICGGTTFNAVTAARITTVSVACRGSVLVPLGGADRPRHRDNAVTEADCVCQGCGAPLLNLRYRLVMAEDVHTFNVTGRVESTDGEVGATINAAYWLADEEPARLREAAQGGWSDEAAIERLAGYCVYSAPKTAALLEDVDEVMGWLSREEAIAWLYRFRPEVYAMCVDEIRFTLHLDCAKLDEGLAFMDEDELLDTASDELGHWIMERRQDEAEWPGICFQFEELSRDGEMVTLATKIINDDLADQVSIDVFRELMLLLAGGALTLPDGIVESPGTRGRVLPFRRA